MSFLHGTCKHCKGACCPEAGPCVDTTRDDCENTLNGVWSGPCTKCPPIDPCLGACCPESGPCVITTRDDCENTLNGVWQGYGTDCTPDPCPGACCLPDGSCVVTTKQLCEYDNGVWQGEGTDCTPDPCLGACCFPGSSCEVTTKELCEYGNGVWQGVGTNCTPPPCPGACCLPDDSCVITTKQLCEYDSGVWKGEGTDCTPDPCPGECCLPDGTCVVTTKELCEYDNGIWLGKGGNCIPDPCPVPGSCLNCSSFSLPLSPLTVSTSTTPFDYAPQEDFGDLGCGRCCPVSSSSGAICSIVATNTAAENSVTQIPPCPITPACWDISGGPGCGQILGEHWAGDPDLLLSLDPCVEFMWWGDLVDNGTPPCYLEKFRTRVFVRSQLFRLSVSPWTYYAHFDVRMLCDVNMMGWSKEFSFAPIVISPTLVTHPTGVFMSIEPIADVVVTDCGPPDTCLQDSPGPRGAAAGPGIVNLPVTVTVS